MARRVLVILAHPDPNSYCAAMASAYSSSAQQAGAEVRELSLGELQFDPIFHRRPEGEQPPEPDLIAAQQAIQWCDHLVFVYPTWWGAMPALMKGFIERTFLPDFAFRYRNNSPWWDKLLTGRSARLLVTMDAPPWYYRLVFRAPGHNLMKRAILGFCGIKPVRIASFGPMLNSSQRRRERWLQRARDLAVRDLGG